MNKKMKTKKDLSTSIFQESKTSVWIKSDWLLQFQKQWKQFKNLSQNLQFCLWCKVLLSNKRVLQSGQKRLKNAIFYNAVEYFKLINIPDLALKHSVWKWPQKSLIFLKIVKIEIHFCPFFRYKNWIKKNETFLDF